MGSHAIWFDMMNRKRVGQMFEQKLQRVIQEIRDGNMISFAPFYGEHNFNEKQIIQRVLRAAGVGEEEFQAWSAAYTKTLSP